METPKRSGVKLGDLEAFFGRVLERIKTLTVTDDERVNKALRVAGVLLFLFVAAIVALVYLAVELISALMQSRRDTRGIAVGTQNKYQVHGPALTVSRPRDDFYALPQHVPTVRVKKDFFKVKMDERWFKW